MISIIISYFESPKYLKKQLEHYSSFDNIELVVVDDNSKIYPLKNSFKYKGIKINNDFPFGNEACKNVGIKEAKYQHVFSSDIDYVLTQKGYDYLQTINDDDDNNLHISYRIKKKKNKWHENLFFCNKKTFGIGYKFYGYY